jgi:hypothetical protein
VTSTRNSIWIDDTTHLDLVGRTWIDEIVSAEETSVQIEVVFSAALQAEGLLDDALERGADAG